MKDDLDYMLTISSINEEVYPVDGQAFDDSEEWE